jgi:hypothetical protein
MEVHARRMPYMNSYLVTEQVYGFAFNIVTGCRLEEAIVHFMRKLKEDIRLYKLPKDNDQVTARFFALPLEQNIKSGLIWLNEGTSIPLLVHECFHAVCYVFDMLEAELNSSTEELYAYYLNWLVEESMKCLKIPTKKRSKKR